MSATRSQNAPAASTRVVRARIRRDRSCPAMMAYRPGLLPSQPVVLPGHCHRRDNADNVRTLNIMARRRRRSEPPVVLDSRMPTLRRRASGNSRLEWCGPATCPRRVTVWLFRPPRAGDRLRCAAESVRALAAGAARVESAAGFDNAVADGPRRFAVALRSVGWIRRGTHGRGRGHPHRRRNREASPRQKASGHARRIMRSDPLRCFPA
jgi:hypothetical protein